MPVLTNSRVVSTSYPSGIPLVANLGCENTISDEPDDGEVLLATKYVLVAIHMRVHEVCDLSTGGMLRPGSIIDADGTAEVLVSRHPGSKTGQIVIGSTGWQSHARLRGGSFRSLPNGCGTGRYFAARHLGWAVCKAERHVDRGNSPSEEECKYAVQTLGFQTAVNRATSDIKIDSMKPVSTG